MQKTTATTIAEYNKLQTKEVADICNFLQTTIDKNLKKSESNIVSKIWHGGPVWFIDGNPVVGYDKLKDSVRLLFWSGQTFKEPNLHKEGSFRAAEIRYIDVDQIVKSDITRWLKKAKEIQWDYKNIVKRKGVLEMIQLHKKDVTQKSMDASTHDRKFAKLIFGSVYPMYIVKVEKKGRTKAELDKVIKWLTGFDNKIVQKLIKEKVTFEEFFQKAILNKNANLITGMICGYRIEDIKNPLTKKVRYLDKLVDELAKGRKMEKILRVE